jgi:hypothetical protein
VIFVWQKSMLWLNLVFAQVKMLGQREVTTLPGLHFKFLNINFHCAFDAKAITLYIHSPPLP